jgi:hypothetical protein
MHELVAPINLANYCQTVWMSWSRLIRLALYCQTICMSWPPPISLALYYQTICMSWSQPISKLMGRDQLIHMVWQ